jgi:acetolactate synthase-1/2/3 large subunit
MSGIGEAFLDGVPMLVISGGIRTDTGHRYQLHDVDHAQLMKALTKAQFKVTAHAELVPMIYEAWRIATGGEPGPVYVEIPLNIAAFAGEAGVLPPPPPATPRAVADAETDFGISRVEMDRAVELLRSAKRPGILAGWGARFCEQSLVALAERLNAPVATTLQGLSVFPGNHGLSVGFSYGPHAVPAAENAFRDCDCLIAIGTRFSEIPTGSYGLKVPEKLIHIDINPQVFNANYEAKVAIAAAAEHAVPMLEAALRTAGYKSGVDGQALRSQIERDRRAYMEEWFAHDSGGRVNPGKFFAALRTALADDAIVVADDGNHTFLTAELMPIHRSRGFISPTDFNCMGYCVPASIGAKLVNPQRQVVGIVGDGAFLMTCMELLTAATHRLGVVQFVFSDGELSQISQTQEIPYNRKTCSVLGAVKLEGVAEATGSAFLALNHDHDIVEIIDEALTIAGTGQPVIVDVKIDYSRRTRFTKGIVLTNLKRFDLGTQVRFVGRALVRRVTG